MSKPVLYSFWRSSCSWRVRIALHLKGIEFDSKNLDPSSEKDMGDPEFVKINPARRIPVLVIDGNVLTESLAIIEYLDETYPAKPLLPKDPVVRAQVRAIALHITSNIQPLQSTRVIKACDAKEAGYGKKFAKQSIEKGLKELEELVAKTASTYCHGFNVTLADLFLPSILYNARRYGVSLLPYPTLLKVNEALSKIPEFAKSEPDQQPGAVAE